MDLEAHFIPQRQKNGNMKKLRLHFQSIALVHILNVCYHEFLAHLWQIARQSHTGISSWNPSGAQIEGSKLELSSDEATARLPVVI